jgi:hypothetical protein
MTQSGFEVEDVRKVRQSMSFNRFHCIGADCEDMETTTEREAGGRNLALQIAQLRQLKTRQLRERYREVFGHDTAALASHLQWPNVGRFGVISALF